MRHFFASIEIAAGIDPVTVAAVLGHSTPQTTIPVPNSNTKPSAVHTDKELSNRHCLLNKSAMPIFLNHLQLC